MTEPIETTKITDTDGKIKDCHNLYEQETLAGIVDEIMNSQVTTDQGQEMSFAGFVENVFQTYTTAERVFNIENIMADDEPDTMLQTSYARELISTVAHLIWKEGVVPQPRTDFVPVQEVACNYWRILALSNVNPERYSPMQPFETALSIYQIIYYSGASSKLDQFVPANTVNSLLRTIVPLLQQNPCLVEYIIEATAPKSRRFSRQGRYKGATLFPDFETWKSQKLERIKRQVTEDANSQ